MLIEPYTWTKILHVLAFAAGLGGAICADLFLLSRAVFRPIQQNTLATVHLIGNIVMVGLVLLWSTGVMLVAIAYANNPAVMLNEKLWVKVFVVVILTLNAAVIHGVAMPTLDNQIGRRFFDGIPLGRRFVLVAAGGVSTVSWLFLTMLGVAKELDRTTPAYQLLACYYGALLAALVPLAALAILAGRWHSPGHSVPFPPRKPAPFSLRHGRHAEAA